MKTLTRKAGVFVAASILAVIFITAVGLPRGAYAARCGSDVSWHIWNSIDSSTTNHTKNGQTTETQDSSSRGEQYSNNGQNVRAEQTHHRNEDGSSHEHAEYYSSDSEGKACGSDGIPTKWSNRQDDDQDSKGNRKWHIEEILEKNGKCEKSVRDREWDSKGNLIKDTTWITSEVPCSKYILEVSMNGSFDVGITVTYGPNTAKVFLELRDDGTYVGNYEGVFDVKEAGECKGFGTIPVTFNVTTSKEDEFGDLDFSVIESMALSFAVVCEGEGGSVNVPPWKGTRTFTLPAQDGASKVYNISFGESGNLTLTFTLKRKT